MSYIVGLGGDLAALKKILKSATQAERVTALDQFLNSEDGKRAFDDYRTVAWKEAEEASKKDYLVEADTILMRLKKLEAEQPELGFELSRAYEARLKGHLTKRYGVADCLKGDDLVMLRNFDDRLKILRDKGKLDEARVIELRRGAVTALRKCVIKAGSAL
ncbi:MAG: hypothetical protein HYV97_04395 [Bdellovibrio sp.]|nr:hypothetical protein [Bdellovibrio sp.]